MNIKYNKALWLIIILAIVMMIPFLGLSDFNTKGEPREAVVAYTMLEHGNWILPINNGGDIPYKPPFFHWCIAFFSLFIGHVNEYTSRLPSAVSLVLMTIGGFVFYAKRKDTQTSLIAAILTLTAFEVHRAGMNCRVDMVNTAFMVGAMYLLYRWWEKGKHQLPWLAILCMSGATLTKGPVGIILPCFVMGVFMLTQRENFWGIVWRMALTALLSLIIPFCWYYAAYLQGGDEFLRLVKEENIDRFMGKMAYESHENPAWYNLLTLITGWLPYTLLLLFSLFILPWKKFSKTRFLENAKKATPLQVFTWLAFLLVLFFYCIPKSKRSVYLLPCYPFMAYLIAEYIVWMMKEKMGAIKVYAGVIASLASHPCDCYACYTSRRHTRYHFPWQACCRQHRHAPCNRGIYSWYPILRMLYVSYNRGLSYIQGTQEKRDKPNDEIYIGDDYRNFHHTRLHPAACRAQHEGRQASGAGYRKEV